MFTFIKFQSTKTIHITFKTIKNMYLQFDFLFGLIFLTKTVKVYIKVNISQSCITKVVKLTLCF